ncbi:hypothetical protein LMG3431_01452 [Achromobacter pestifer]|uniref:Uncharacterized protein n=1 Tax=Achromobacter pestifer TaxID=1353889 RepID=A0A6S6Z9L9_9BURK|nr:hypothetical protein LMG3431_01452 [Achromobacter pestifer]
MLGFEPERQDRLTPPNPSYIQLNCFSGTRRRPGSSSPSYAHEEKRGALRRVFIPIGPRWRYSARRGLCPTSGRYERPKSALTGGNYPALCGTVNGRKRPLTTSASVRKPESLGRSQLLQASTTVPADATYRTFLQLGTALLVVPRRLEQTMIDRLPRAKYTWSFRQAIDVSAIPKSALGPVSLQHKYHDLAQLRRSG